MFTIRQRSLLQIGALVVITFFLALIFSAGFVAAALWAIVLGIAFGFLLRQNIRVAEGVDILREDVPLDMDAKVELVRDTLGLSDNDSADAPSDEASDAGDVSEPTKLDAPREGGPDDLTRISGVGPKLRDMLHEMGFYHFDQIANWTDKELNWVDQNLDGFKGRASRDRWVEQARELASG